MLVTSKGAATADLNHHPVEEPQGPWSLGSESLTRTGSPGQPGEMAQAKVCLAQGEALGPLTQQRAWATHAYHPGGLSNPFGGPTIQHEPPRKSGFYVGDSSFISICLPRPHIR